MKMPGQFSVTINKTTIHIEGDDCHLFDEKGIAYERRVDMEELGYQVPAFNKEQ